MSAEPFPNVNDRLTDKDGMVGQAWLYLLLTLYNRTGGGAPAAPIPITVTVGNPFTYQAPLSGAVAVAGSGVSNIKLVRDGDEYETGQTAGMIPVMRGDSVVVTYTSAPVMTLFPSEAT